jgi:hypothetical protein
MKFNSQLSYSESELKKLFTDSLQQWCGGYQSGLTVDINCNSSGQVSGIALMYLGGKNNSFITFNHDVRFSHDVIAAGICQALAAKGEAIDPTSLTFKYDEGHGYRGGSSFSATANEATAEVQLANGANSETSAAKAGVANFPSTVYVDFGVYALLDLLNDAVRRSGNQPTYVTFLFTDKRNCAVNVIVKTKNGRDDDILLNSNELKTALRDELTARGYTVEEDCLRYSQSQGGYGNRYGASVTVTCTGFPIRKA